MLWQRIEKTGSISVSRNRSKAPDRIWILDESKEELKKQRLVLDWMLLRNWSIFYLGGRKAKLRLRLFLVKNDSYSA